jgi:epoxyqueuosine reductase QueG
MFNDLYGGSGARAVVVSTMFYWPGKNGFPTIPVDEENPRGAVSSYAWGEDYHDTLGTRIKELGVWLHQRCGGQGAW